MVKSKTSRSKLNCRECGLTLINAPQKINEGELILAEWAVAENILGAAPQAGDELKLTCKCGSLILGFTPEYFVLEE